MADIHEVFLQIHREMTKIASDLEIIRVPDNDFQNLITELARLAEKAAELAVELALQNTFDSGDEPA